MTEENTLEKEGMILLFAVNQKQLPLANNIVVTTGVGMCLPNLTKKMTKVKILPFLVFFLTRFRISRIIADRLERRIGKIYVIIVIVVQRLKVILINVKS